MRKLFKYVLIVMTTILLIVVLAVLFDSSTINLNKGYYYSDDIQHISNWQNLDNNSIPPYVIDYNYNKNFIIAKQKPKFPQDIMYKSYHYKNGEDATYYWLIVHTEKLVLGPLDSIEYLSYRIKYNVPEKLKFKK